MSFYRIRGLGGAIQQVSQANELKALVSYLERWFTPKTFAEPGQKLHARRHLVLEGETFRWDPGAGAKPKKKR